MLLVGSDCEELAPNAAAAAAAAAAADDDDDDESQQREGRGGRGGAGRGEPRVAGIYLFRLEQGAASALTASAKPCINNNAGSRSSAVFRT